jgi:hypothetical protein
MPLLSYVYAAIYHADGSCAHREAIVSVARRLKHPGSFAGTMKLLQHNRILI